MEIKTLTFQVYKWNELEEKIKSKLIDKQIQYYVEEVPYEHLSDGMRKSIIKAEQMQTPWFAGSYIWDDNKEEVLSGLIDGKYLCDGTTFEYIENIQAITGDLTSI